MSHALCCCCAGSCDAVLRYSSSFTYTPIPAAQTPQQRLTPPHPPACVEHHRSARFKERSEVRMCSTHHAGVLQPTSMPKSSMLVFTASSNSSYSMMHRISATIVVWEANTQRSGRTCFKTGLGAICNVCILLKQHARDKQRYGLKTDG
jgi:hypothetical protein